MSKPCFLADEHMDREVVKGIIRYNAVIDILHVGDPDAPPIGTLDPDILDFCERTHRILVTANRKSMPLHIAEFYAAGRRCWGILKVRKGHEEDIGGIIESLALIWELEEAEDYLDREVWIPL